MPDFNCTVCGESFSIPQTTLDRFPGWEPKFCRAHSPAKKKTQKKAPSRSRAGGRASGTQELDLTLDEVLARFADGPDTGVFTDGGARPNPGPGGWGFVHVVGGDIVEQRHGHDASTTNNRMELTALIEAYRHLPEDAEITVYSDSNLCVQSINEWAAGWKRRGWTRKTGPIKNVELVRELYELHTAHRGVSLEWIKAHNGWRWNEYADSLATAWTRAAL